MILRVSQMSFDKWLDVSARFMSEVNYILDHLNLEVKMINQLIPKVETTSKHKYD